MKLEGGDPAQNENLPETVPTIGVGMEEIAIKNVKIKVWDLSGQSQMRGTWKYYYEYVNGIIFVVDSTNREQMGEVRDQLHQVINETADSYIPILIFANKQDIEGALGYSEVRNELALAGESELKRMIKIQEASGKTNSGLLEGFDWLVKTIEERQLAKK